MARRDMTQDAYQQYDARCCTEFNDKAGICTHREHIGRRYLRIPPDWLTCIQSKPLQNMNSGIRTLMSRIGEIPRSVSEQQPQRMLRGTDKRSHRLPKACVKRSITIEPELRYAAKPMVQQHAASARADCSDKFSERQ